jgi:hypothetical protein
MEGRPVAVERDFTHDIYRKLLTTLVASGYRFHTFSQVAEQGAGPHVLLRHDVDRLPSRSVAMATLESECGACATYFFRVRAGRFDAQAVREVSALGHEIGYHYEDLVDARGDVDHAWELFQRNLDRLRSVATVWSIAMHGRPLSRWDSRDLWRRHDYRVADIKCEAYLDIDWTRWRYFTDTGRAWNGAHNARDFPTAEQALPLLKVRSTKALDQLLQSDRPDAVISSHPERWTAGVLGWMQVLATDLAVSAVKRILKPRRAAATATG